MSDQNDTPAPSTRDPRADLENARTVGAWMPWVGLAAALAWWGGCAALALSPTVNPLLAAAPAFLVAAGMIGAALPGVLILMAAFMARESRRSAASNALVLEAAATLLDPGASARAEAQTLASVMAASAANVDKTVGHALSAMKALAGEIGDERMRLESVAYAAADNSRDLGERLQNERAALEALAKALKVQTDGMSESIPRQSAIMVEAARRAGEEFGQADEALEHRMQALDGSANTLGAKLVDLDALAVDAGKRVETLTFAITRLEEKLEQSRKTVDSAVRAGEHAAAAAGTMGDSLKDAANAAIADAQNAAADIRARTREASETAARDLAELRAQCDHTVAAIKATSVAARAETDMAEKRLASTTGMIARAAERTVSDLTEPAAAPAAPAAPMPPQPAPTIAPSAPQDEVLFEDTGAAAAPPEPAPAEPQSAPLALDQRIEDAEFEEAPLGGDVPVRLNGGHTPDETPVIRRPEAEMANGDGAAWADILADIDGDDAPPLDREETAEALISRLQTSGIKLPEMFKPKDKRKIASAARKGDSQRRNAIKDAAGRQVDRVYKRLSADKTLRHLAETFVEGEADEALVALEQTSKSGRNASPRLSAFLLLDTALADAAPR